MMNVVKKNYVSNRNETPRMFSHPLLEFFSKVHWSLPLVAFVPVITLCLIRAIDAGIGFMSVGFVFLAGTLFWTFAEYLMHRFVFHFPLRGRWGMRIHFVFHGVHHDYPSDAMRLVMPPAVSMPLALMYYFLFSWIMPVGYVHAFFAGFVSGYLVYDMMHYALHHVTLHQAWFLKLKKHHFRHHFQDAEAGFGVSSPFWDRIFRTSFK